MPRLNQPVSPENLESMANDLRAMAARLDQAAVKMRRSKIRGSISVAHTVGVRNGLESMEKLAADVERKIEMRLAQP